MMDKRGILFNAHLCYSLPRRQDVVKLTATAKNRTPRDTVLVYSLLLILIAPGLSHRCTAAVSLESDVQVGIVMISSRPRGTWPPDATSSLCVGITASNCTKYRIKEVYLFLHIFSSQVRRWVRYAIPHQRRMHTYAHGRASGSFL